MSSLTIVLQIQWAGSSIYHVNNKSSDGIGDLQFLDEMRNHIKTLNLAALDAIFAKSEGNISDVRMNVLNENSDYLLRNMERLETMAVNDEQKKNFVDIRKNIAGLTNLVRGDLVRAVINRSNETEFTRIREATNEASMTALQKFDEFEKTTQQAIDLAHANVEQKMSHALRLIWLTFLVFLVAIISWLLKTIDQTTHKMDRLLGNMNAMAAGSVEGEIEGQDDGDEFGQMARVLQAIKNNAALRYAPRMSYESSIDEPQRITAQVTAGMESRLHAALSGVTAVASQISAAMKRTADVAGANAGKTQAVSEQSDKASEDVIALLDSCKKLAASMNEVNVQIKRSSDISGAVMGDVQKVDDALQKLVESAGTVGRIVSLMDVVVSQIHLLSLNATIEAARAGEAGKGFAVVAAEVKNLANQAGKTSEEITDHIKKVQSVSGEVAEAIATVNGAMGELSKLSGTTFTAVDLQVNNARELIDGVQRSANRTRDISGYVAGVANDTANVGTVASQSLNVVQEMIKRVSHLNQEVTELMKSIR